MDVNNSAADQKESLSTYHQNWNVSEQLDRVCFESYDQPCKILILITDTIMPIGMVHYRWV